MRSWCWRQNICKRAFAPSGINQNTGEYQNGHIALAIPIVNAVHEVNLSIGCFFSPLNKGKGVEKKVLGVLKKAAAAIARHVSI